MKRKGTFLWRMVVGVMFISSSAFAQESPSKALPKGEVRIEQLSSKAQFQALPDDTLLEIGGRKIRKADFVADFNRRAAAARAGAAIRPSGLAAIQARLIAEENAAIAASAAEVRRRLAEIRARGGDR